MTKRLSVGVLLLALVTMLATTASAERPKTGEWRGGDPNAMPNSGLPLFFRSTAGTTWVSVGMTCELGSDTANSSHTPDEVWCFSSGGTGWPNVPPAQNTSSSHEAWDSWSKFDPPISQGSKWHVTQINTGPTGGSYNAWAGCDTLENYIPCRDAAFWVYNRGYGDDWRYSLTLEMNGMNATSGGTVEFDVKYDCECLYDYMYLEYLDNVPATPVWTAVTDTAGARAVFNAVSGNPDLNHGGTGRECAGDIFHASDQKDLGGGVEFFYGNSVWIENVTFPFPNNPGGLQLRWRVFSDGAWSDADGSGDTNGLGNIDNVLVTFNAGGSVSDNFETGGFSGVSAGGTWVPGELVGPVVNYWEMQFDPSYKNKGSTCTFSPHWMFASRPLTGGIPSDFNGFSYFLVSPVIDCNGWTGAVMEYANYMCAPPERNDYTNTQARFYDANKQLWGLWQDFDGFITFAGCEFWNMNETEDASRWLKPEIDSLQFGYEMLDTCVPTDFCWGKHGTVTWLIDNVSIGSFDGSSTVFEARGIDTFADTYSLNDPSHTPFMQNEQQGFSPGGQLPLRPFADQDSLNVAITDFDGVAAGSPTIYWRISEVDPPVFGVWQSKAMNYSTPDPQAAGAGGDYRTVIGKDGAGGEDYNPAAGLIWEPGTTVQYYVSSVDEAGSPNTAVWPRAAGDPDPTYFSFEVLPFTNRVVGSQNERILIVDDYTRNTLDFENSSGFDPVGGAGNGGFSDPVFDQPEDMVERALGLIYGIATPEDNPAWDIYDVLGGGSSVQCEPRIVSAAPWVGAIGDDIGAPVYDAVIWMNGTFDEYSFFDQTRIDLKAFLNEGGHLWSNGDDVAKYLGTGGDNADSTIGFLSDFMGVSFLTITDDETTNRVLKVAGAADSSLDSVEFTIYGECPTRRAFDRLTEAASSVENRIETLATYEGGGAGDNGRAAIIKCVRLVGDPAVETGVCIHSGFGLGAMVSDQARAILLARTFVTDFGLWESPYLSTLVDAPVVANSRFGFDLAQSSPNPFANSTQIRFSVPNRGHVSIEVYNILGQKVRTLVNESMEANSYVREWDGRADTGERVSSGIYFYKMVAGDYSATRKTVLLK